MNELIHQQIAQRINRRAEIERENARMEEIERAATPLFYAVMAVAAAVVVWLATADYRDVLQHRYDTALDRLQFERMSEIVAKCANSGLAPFDGALLRCERVELVGGLK